MDLIKIAAQLFLDKVGNNASGSDLSSIIAGLAKLLPTDSRGELDLQGLITKFMDGNSNLSSLASSWLGGGDNKSFSVEQLFSILGEDKISTFANDVGMQSGAAAKGLTQMLPELIDKSSTGGTLSSDLSGALVKGIMGKLF